MTPALVKEWVIDVCATCGALATSNCGHAGDRQWTIPVHVRPRYPGEYRAQMLREERRRRMQLRAP